MGRFKNRSGGRAKGLRRTIRHGDHEEQQDQTPRSGPKPDEVHLRRMRADAAMDKLAMEVERHRHAGTKELLIVHGKGMNSAGGMAVIPGLVMDWIRDNPDKIASWRPAPVDWGGEGAVVVNLKGMA